MKISLSEQFDEGVKRLKEKGCKKIYKQLLHYDPDSGVVKYIGDHPYKLDDEIELKDGEYWVPCYWDGKTFVHSVFAPDGLPPKMQTPRGFDKGADKEAMTHWLMFLRCSSQMRENKKKPEMRQNQVYLERAHEDGRSKPATELSDWRPVKGASEARSAHDFLKKAVALLTPDESESEGRLWEMIRHAYNAGRYAEMNDRLTHQHHERAILGEPSAAQILKRINGEYKRTSGDLSEAQNTILKAYDAGHKPKAIFEAMFEKNWIKRAGCDGKGRKLYKLTDRDTAFLKSSFGKVVFDARQLRDKLK